MKRFRKIVWKIWKIFLVISIPLSIASMFLMAMCVDSDTPIPAIIGTINASWLLLLAIANDSYRIEQEKKNRREKKKHGVKDKQDCA